MLRQRSVNALGRVIQPPDVESLVLFTSGVQDGEDLFAEWGRETLGTGQHPPEEARAVRPRALRTRQPMRLPTRLR